MIRIENDRIRIGVSEHGAELRELFDKCEGQHRLWNADPKYWNRTSPILFPNVGKVYNGVMRTDKGEAKLGQHGFARDMNFTTIEKTESRIAFELNADAETLGKYPYDFTLQISYDLYENGIIVSWKVRNNGEGCMPFTIGGHPAFVFPASEPEKKDHSIYFPGLNRLVSTKLDLSLGCTIDSTFSVDLDKEHLALSEELFNCDTLVCDGSQIAEAWLCAKNGRPIIGVIAEGFPSFGIWSAPGSSFVCLEPWQGHCDDVGFNGMYAEKTGAIVLNNGEIYETSYRIELPKNT